MLMQPRLEALAKAGCDAVLPIAIDCYEHEACLEQAGSVAMFRASMDYLTWLAQHAHALDMAIGQLDAPGIILICVGGGGDKRECRPAFLNPLFLNQ